MCASTGTALISNNSRSRTKRSISPSICSASSCAKSRISRSSWQPGSAMSSAVAARSLPIGAGVIEGTCKRLATQRLKRSAMRWRHAGGQAVSTLHARVHSNRFDHAWRLLSDTYQTDVTMPEPVVALTRSQAA